MHAALQRVRFGARTVPAMTLGRRADRRLAGDHAPPRGARARAAAVPGSDAELRAEVERAEEWGDEVLQPIARRLLWPAFMRAPDALASYQEGSTLPALPAPVVRALAPAVTRIERRLNRAGDGAVRADLRALPRHLDRIDGWIDRGMLGGPRRQRGRPADRRDDAPAADDRRRAPAHRGPPRSEPRAADPRSDGGLDAAGALPADWLAEARAPS